MSSLTDFESELARTKALLLTPRVADPERAIPALEQAVAALASLRLRLSDERTNLSPVSMAKLKSELRDLAALAKQAGGHYLGCAAILESMTQLYTAVGTAASTPSSPSLSIEG